MNLLIRADASALIGTGHIMRTLALAQAWQSLGGEISYTVSECPAGLLGRLQNEKCSVSLIGTVEAGSVEDAGATIEAAERIGAQRVVVDGYQFGPSFQTQLIEAGLKVLLLDDCGHYSNYPADLVLNQNSYADESLYPHRNEHTKLLLGSRFVLLRREFLESERPNRDGEKAPERILVTVGGSDPHNATRTILRALNLWTERKLKVRVLIGAGFNDDCFEAEVDRGKHDIELIKETVDMPGQLNWADVAITAAGSTIWECLYLRVPFAVLTVSENQEANAADLQRAGSAIYLGSCQTGLSESDILSSINELLVNPEKNRCGQIDVDGFGTNRVIAELRGDRIWLRQATGDDCRLLWEWANDPAVRSASFNQEEIPWEDHVKWFQIRMADEHSRSYIAINENEQAIGQIRFDRVDGRTQIGFSLDFKARGQSLGVDLIKLGTEKFRSEGFRDDLHAWAKSANISSQKAFVRAGYETAGEEEVNGAKANHFVAKAS
ncbi:MAG: UDP-2,4-diacetamido-2,4,6-trideoxy-beta-L-altropyranose hydrolase [Verrucomicrobiales bacterium]|nr:UDP-2,4-diacetamido-2,4,6-trideoxy-beta-L-altropyranose hydrolase [Verrucomicrobiales bacterium]